MAVSNKMTAAPLEDRLAQLLAVLEARTKLLAFFFGLCFVAAALVLALSAAGVIPGMIRLIR
ncbi:hypothetical protein [Candidatus Electronema sp. JC]|uniref:hypothetical protein n=1 Tax=Candidatus Electronema sp. JC TaxID=3401570 RepID=UPI003B433869